MKLSLTVFALLGHIKVNAINVQSIAEATTMTEETRYIGSDGLAINLAQTVGHARLNLNRIKKYSQPQPIETMDV